MIVERDFKTLLPDNDENYFSLLEGVVDSIDEYSRMTISKSSSEFIFRIAPSEAVYMNALIKAINSLNNLLKLRINYSKSIKSSAVIIFRLPL